MFKKILALCLTIALLVLTNGVTFAAKNSILFITDGEAKSEAMLYAEGMPNDEITVVLIDEDGNRSSVLAQADNEGKIQKKIQLPENSGTYTAYIPGRKNDSMTTFQVISKQKPSQEESYILVNASKAFADLEDSVRLTVVVRDENANAVVGKVITLMSVDKGVVISDPTKTDERGNAEFTVRSSASGKILLNAYDKQSRIGIGETTIEFLSTNDSMQQATSQMPQQMAYPYYYPPYPAYGQYPMPTMYPMYGAPAPVVAPSATATSAYPNQLATLDQQLKELEAALKNVETGKSRGGDLLGASLLDIRNAYAQASTVDHFEFEIDESSIQLNEPTSFIVRALDDTDNVVTDYEGTVTFSSTDSDTILPSDYTFELADQGEHEFTLAVFFLNDGQQTLTVADVEDQDIKGETELNIGGTTPTQKPKPVNTIDLTSPRSGITASTSQTISGKTRADSSVTVFDGEKILGTVSTDADGNFTYTANALAEGKHIIKMESEHIPTGEITDSHPVEITIDITPPIINSVTLNPTEPIEEGDTVTVTVNTEAESEVFITLNDLSFKLTQQNGGLYASQIIAPQGAGEYPISIVAKDKIGNEGVYVGEVKLVVKKKRLPVSNVLAISDEESVQLEWDNFENAERYKISYGTSKGVYGNIVTTVDNTPAYVLKNLTGGSTYYIAIEALNAIGQPISLPSQEIFARALVKIIAVPIESASVVTPPFTQNPPQVTQTGPEMYIIFAASLLFLDMYARVRRKLKKSLL